MKRHHLPTRFQGISSGITSCQKPYTFYLGLRSLLDSGAGSLPLVLSTGVFSFPTGEERNEVDEPLTPPLGFAFLQASQPRLLRAQEEREPEETEEAGPAGALPTMGQTCQRGWVSRPLAFLSLRGSRTLSRGVFLASLFWEGTQTGLGERHYGVRQETLASSPQLSVQFGFYRVR